MEITPRELRDTEIHSEMRGYSRDEVNDLLERAATSIDAANERVTQLQDRLTSAQSEATRTRETEDILHRTLLLAQRAADEAVAEATAKSRQMLDDAEMSSRRLVAESEAEARRKGEAERRRLEQEIVELAGRRDTLLADVEALTRFEAEYRERMVRALETDLSTLKTRATTAPASKPEPSDVEIPAATTPAASGPAVPDPTGASPTSASPFGAVPFGGSARTPEDRPAPRESAGPATSEVDVRTLFEQSQERGQRDFTSDEPALDLPAREQLPREQPAHEESAQEQPAYDSDSGESPKAERSHAEPSRSEAPAPADEPAPADAARAAGFQPIDLAGNDPVDANILDDDAFFATLRDAVHDEKPLGPRDEGDDPTGENAFFDQDADRGSFRDVFRRRR
jgi:cell division septum initiation protein DivIVA